MKFSGTDDSPQERRWADLLVCEHLAFTTITDTLHLKTAQNRIYQYVGRTFYEVCRFERHGEFGRSGVCSWHELNAALFGGTGTWSEEADALLNAKYIYKEPVQQIKLLEHFGRLIANTDMHDGNLSFLPNMDLASAYDMLSMLYAPQRGIELVDRLFNPALPLPKERNDWIQAAQVAILFWQRVQDADCISLPFHETTKLNEIHISQLLKKLK